MTRYFYDTEFIEDGRTIELISIGIVAEDGPSYYAVNSDMPWERIVDNDWLLKNVVSSLPLSNSPKKLKEAIDGKDFARRYLTLDRTSCDVKPKWVIANEVRRWLFLGTKPIELWADYAAYDHVALAQLWGAMNDIPAGIPMFTNDIQQEIAKLTPGENNKPPEQTGTAHNALDDARHVKAQWEWLATKAWKGHIS